MIITKNSYAVNCIGAAIFILVLFNLVEAEVYRGMLELEEFFYFDNSNLSELKTKTGAIKLCEKYFESKSKKLKEKGFVVLDSICNKDIVIHVLKQKDNRTVKVKTIEGKIIFYPNPKLNKPIDTIKNVKKLFYYNNENYPKVKTEADAIKACKKHLKSKNIKLEEKGFVVLKSFCKRANYTSIKKIDDKIIYLMVIESIIIFYPNPKS